MTRGAWHALLVVIALSVAQPAHADTKTVSDLWGLTVTFPSTVLRSVPFHVLVTWTAYANGTSRWPAVAEFAVQCQDGPVHELNLTMSAIGALGGLVGPIVCGEVSLRSALIRLTSPLLSAPVDTRASVLPAVVSLLPPVLTLVLAIACKHVVLALFCGALFGSLLIEELNPAAALLRTADTHMASALGLNANVCILLFTFLIGGTLGVVARMGGMDALAHGAQRYASNARRTQLCVLALGLVVFFDGITSVVLVGHAMSGTARRSGVSPVKFAFNVHTMAVALVSISPVSSWVGLQVGYISTTFASSKLSTAPYLVFLQTLPMRFFALELIFWLVALVVTGRDFGFMVAQAPSAPVLSPRERARARAAGGMRNELDDGRLASLEVSEVPQFAAFSHQTLTTSLSSTPEAPADPEPDDTASAVAVDRALVPDKSFKPRVMNAAVPFLLVALVALGGILYDGFANLAPHSARTLSNVIAAADATKALLWAALSGSLCSGVLAVCQGMSVRAMLRAWIDGLAFIFDAMLVLILAFTLSSVIAMLNTAVYIALACHQMGPALLPALTTLLAMAISFSTGSSFGTMAILFPLAVPLAVSLASTSTSPVVVQTTAGILNGCIFGNVLSPIAENTVLIAAAAGCSIADHVRTSTPYVVLVALVSLVTGTIPCGFEIYPPEAGLLIGFLVLTLVLFAFGRKPSPHASASA